MFDVGFSELVVIGVVALVVIGPERLPKVARTAGLLLGRLQRYVGDVKADINREIQLDELKKLQQQMTDQVSGLQASVTHEMREVESSLNTAIPPPTDATVVGPQSEPAPTPQGIPQSITPEASQTVDAQAAQALGPAVAAPEAQKS